MGYSDFPFTIEQIALDLLNLKERHRGAVSFDVDCPFCGKRGKMNINTRKTPIGAIFAMMAPRVQKAAAGCSISMPTLWAV